MILLLGELIYLDGTNLRNLFMKYDIFLVMQGFFRIVIVIEAFSELVGGEKKQAN